MFCFQGSISLDTSIEGKQGKILEAKIVFARAIEYMKNHALKHLTDSGLPYLEDETKWVVTVPAVWPDPSKTLMRAAAEQVCVLYSV